jgi:hypothetical protein
VLKKDTKKKPMALGWTLSTSGPLWAPRLKMFYILYIFELGINRKYGKKDVGDVGKAPKKIALR